jgi:hypothetical protein
MSVISLISTPILHTETNRPNGLQIGKFEVHVLTGQAVFMLVRENNAADMKYDAFDCGKR